MTNKDNTTFYVGVTSDLQKRIGEHKEGIDSNSFTARYNIKKLVYYEQIDGIENAIKREKQLKSWRRDRKVNIIEINNKEYRDLFNDLFV